MEKKYGAVVIGGDFQGLGVIHSLAEQNIPLFLMDYERGIARYSRHATRTATNFSLFDDGRFLDCMISLAKNERLEGWVLFPNNDECVKELAIHNAELAQWYRNPVPPWEITEKFYNKTKTYEIADAIGVPIPRMYNGTCLDDILQKELDFPIVLKPCHKERYYRITKKKAVRVDSREALIKEYRKMAGIIPPSEIIVQDMIPGGSKSLFSFATVFDGQRVIAGMSARRWRQHPMDFGKATTYAESSIIPELESLATKLLKVIGFSGIAEVEFMWDERDGLFRFLEINGRIWGWHTLARAAGINLSYILYKLMLDEQVARPPEKGGIKWMRPITDIPTAFKEILGRRMSIQEYLNQIRRVHQFAVYSREDPYPFMMEFLLLPYLWRKRGS